MVGSGFDVVDVCRGTHDGTEQFQVAVINHADEHRRPGHFQPVVADVPDDVQIGSAVAAHGAPSGHQVHDGGGRQHGRPEQVGVVAAQTQIEATTERRERDRRLWLNATVRHVEQVRRHDRRDDIVARHEAVEWLARRLGRTSSAASDPRA